MQKSSRGLVREEEEGGKDMVVDIERKGRNAKVSIWSISFH